MPGPSWICANGHENVAEARYCVVCGAVMGGEAPASPGAATAGLSTAGMSAGGTAAGGEPTTKRGPAFRLSRRVVLIACGVVGALVIVGGAAFLLFTSPAPDVTGLEPSAAAERITAEGFEVGSRSEEFSDTVPAGSVAGQSPGPGQRTGKGGAVDLVISRGPAVVVPDLQGVAIGVATKDLKDLDLGVDRQPQVSETVPEGTIIAQQPAAGEQVEQGSDIRLVVSSGPPRTTVTAEVDLTSISLDNDLTDCSIVVMLFSTLYSRAVVENGQGEQVSSISGRWTEDPSNGNYFPCVVTATFPDTPTTEDSYRLELSPNDSSDGAGDTYTRSELESNDWVLRYS